MSIYHEPGDDAPAAWSAVGRLARCRDSIYHESSSDKIDGVLDVTFTVPHRNMSGESSKELSLDLEVPLLPRWPRPRVQARGRRGGVFVMARLLRCLVPLASSKTVRVVCTTRACALRHALLPSLAPHGGAAAAPKASCE